MLSWGSAWGRQKFMRNIFIKFFLLKYFYAKAEFCFSKSDKSLKFDTLESLNLFYIKQYNVIFLGFTLKLLNCT